jgi:hypothetical protein
MLFSTAFTIFLFSPCGLSADVRGKIVIYLFFLFQMCSQLVQHYWLNILYRLKLLLSTRWLMLNCFSALNMYGSITIHVTLIFLLFLTWTEGDLGKNITYSVTFSPYKYRGVKWEVWPISNNLFNEQDMRVALKIFCWLWKKNTNWPDIMNIFYIFHSMYTYNHTYVGLTQCYILF